MRCYLSFLVLIAMLPPANPCSAKIYKYQKGGVWYYTNSPPQDMPEERQEMDESGGTVSPASGRDGAPLLKDYPAHNAIEKAATATVVVQTAMGSGSGFFISTSGHIVTNKHVVRTPEQQASQIDDFFEKADKNAEDGKKRFAREKEQLKAYKAKLDRLKKTAEKENDRSRKASYENEYRYRKQEYDDWEADHRRRYQEFKSRLDQYESRRGNYQYSRSVADLAQSFTVVLVDDTELYARLIALSDKNDLALLKVDGYLTPALEPAKGHRLAQGDQVYAIGNPANLKNTVTSGIFSGYEGDFLQTNAQINPGNSGGPLIDPAGHVLGVNTKKKVGSAIEGLGFAIPIQTVMEEFQPYLP
ncbi:MAG: trypsin-like peptidase domain-containing protein [Desulfobacteraceae bacterium]